MLFNSYAFIFVFLPIAFAGYYLIAKKSHAGAIISGGKGGAKDKIKKMEECGITVAESPSIIGKTLFNKLSN